MSNNATTQNADSGLSFSIHDLKCGNIVDYSPREGEKYPVVINWQHLRMLTENPDTFNSIYSPISLTEDWLLRFGFLGNGYNRKYIAKDFKSGKMILDFVLSKPLSKGEWNKTYTFDIKAGRMVPLKFVHELQNLYFCLTEEMLAKI